MRPRSRWLALIRRMSTGTGLSAPSACEGAGLVAEQLGIDQALRHRRAVQRDIVVARAVARGVNRAREHVLADAGLAMQQHRQIVVADASEPLHAFDKTGITAGEPVQRIESIDGYTATWRRRLRALRRRNMPLP